jgi:uncharacterized Zn finger protein (UPF0148 family)
MSEHDARPATANPDSPLTPSTTCPLCGTTITELGKVAAGYCDTCGARTCIPSEDVREPQTVGEARRRMMRARTFRAQDRRQP